MYSIVADQAEMPIGPTVWGHFRDGSSKRGYQVVAVRELVDRWPVLVSFSGLKFRSTLFQGICRASAWAPCPSDFLSPSFVSLSPAPSPLWNCHCSPFYRMLGWCFSKHEGFLLHSKRFLNFVWICLHCWTVFREALGDIFETWSSFRARRGRETLGKGKLVGKPRDEERVFQRRPERFPRRSNLPWRAKGLPNEFPENCWESEWGNY